MTDKINTAEDLIERKKVNWPAGSSPIGGLVIRLFRIRDIIYENSRIKVKREFDLTPAEFEVIATLRTLEPPFKLTPTELREATLITPGGITKVLNNLETRNLISRHKSANDKRSMSVKLTKKGITLAEKVLPAVLEDYGQQLSKGLNKKQIDETAILLKSLLRALEPYDGNNK
ncbi:MAG: MarR family transcriptional regulator [Rhodospirillaceae bacterium]|nr:MarR family transcriptional regulator [Rhodospirillaceae bacterium]MBT4590073.1 MarR family transcriptional regulator [Rhodospirillaceae bacterium]MBT4937653.1 MarR family transcriptional regulator [Rhodospirillaceae bacterium]MBT7268560.1 MarR family transcriptional regulator [Rhodospirillaceae bacterium]